MTNGKTILVVDDEKAICELIKALLESEGFKILTANSGEDGLALLENMIPNLIILDMNMPKMSGIDFYSKIASPKNAAPTIPVLVLTGRGNMKAMFEGLDVDGFLSKPFNAAELIEMVKKIVNKDKNQQAG